VEFTWTAGTGCHTQITKSGTAVATYGVSLHSVVLVYVQAGTTPPGVVQKSQLIQNHWSHAVPIVVLLKLAPLVILELIVPYHDDSYHAQVRPLIYL
jgi:hypothetical protein